MRAIVIERTGGASELRLAPDCFELVLDGEPRPRIDRTLPLARAREAHALLEAKAVSGRIVLLPSQPLL